MQNQSIETDPEITPMIEFIDKHSKTVIIKVFHMLKKTRTRHYFFSVKGQIVHNLGFPDHTISVTTNIFNSAIIAQKAAINSVLTNRSGCVPIQLIHTTNLVGQIWLLRQQLSFCETEERWNMLSRDTEDIKKRPK